MRQADSSLPPFFRHTVIYRDREKERMYDCATNSDHRPSARHRPGRVGDGGYWHRTRSGRRRVGIAADPLSSRPALIREAVIVVIGQNQMVEERNAEQFARVAQALREHMIFWTRSRIARGVIMRTEPGAGIH